MYWVAGHQVVEARPSPGPAGYEVGRRLAWPSRPPARCALTDRSPWPGTWSAAGGATAVFLGRFVAFFRALMLRRRRDVDRGHWTSAVQRHGGLVWGVTRRCSATARRGLRQAWPAWPDCKAATALAGWWWRRSWSGTTAADGQRQEPDGEARSGGVRERERGRGRERGGPSGSGLDQGPTGGRPGRRGDGRAETLAGGADACLRIGVGLRDLIPVDRRDRCRAWIVPLPPRPATDEPVFYSGSPPTWRSPAHRPRRS